MPRALIAVDEPLLREQLKRRLAEAWPELDIAAEATTGAEAVAAFDADPAEIAFLDIRMPVMTGLEVARAIGDRAHVVFAQCGQPDLDSLQKFRVHRLVPR